MHVFNAFLAFFMKLCFIESQLCLVWPFLSKIKTFLSKNLGCICFTSDINFQLGSNYQKAFLEIEKNNKECSSLWKELKKAL